MQRKGTIPLLLTACVVSCASTEEPAPSPPGPGPPPIPPAAIVEAPPAEPESEPDAALTAEPPAPSPAADPGWIVPRPIRFDEERRRLTREYALAHTGLPTETITPRVIVIHHTGGHSTEGAFRTFDRARLVGRERLREQGALNVSAHFLVARDGTVYRLMPDTGYARHVIGLNHLSIGVENVGAGDLTDEQLAANARLVEHLARAHPTITHLIGHHEYRALEGTELFVEQVDGYRTAKVDPGSEFMRRLRGILKDRGVVLREPQQR